MSKSDDETDMTKFYNLIDKVVKVDLEAGLYLGKIVSDVNMQKSLNFVNSDSLICAFMWDKTEQGKSFWRNINNKLKEYNEKE